MTSVRLPLSLSVWLMHAVFCRSFLGDAYRAATASKHPVLIASVVPRFLAYHGPASSPHVAFGVRACCSQVLPNGPAQESASAVLQIVLTQKEGESQDQYRYRLLTRHGRRSPSKSFEVPFVAYLRRCEKPEVRRRDGHPRPQTHTLVSSSTLFARRAHLPGPVLWRLVRHRHLHSVALIVEAPSTHKLVSTPDDLRLTQGPTLNRSLLAFKDVSTSKPDPARRV